MDERERALESLKKQIKEQRARLDPRTIAQAEKILRGEKTDTVPYDKKSAAETIRLFLESHPDSSGFEKRLIEQLKKNK